MEYLPYIAPAVVALLLGLNAWRFKGKNKVVDGVIRVLGGGGPGPDDGGPPRGP